MIDRPHLGMEGTADIWHALIKNVQLLSGLVSFLTIVFMAIHLCLLHSE